MGVIFGIDRFLSPRAGGGGRGTVRGYGGLFSFLQIRQVSEVGQQGSCLKLMKILSEGEKDEIFVVVAVDFIRLALLVLVEEPAVERVGEPVEQVGATRDGVFVAL
jgi:hypothetical protein